jgi:hypothetical protein
MRLVKPRRILINRMRHKASHARNLRSARQRRSASASNAEPKPRPRQAASTASRPISNSGTSSGMLRRSFAEGSACRFSARLRSKNTQSRAPGRPQDKRHRFAQKAPHSRAPTLS